MLLVVDKCLRYYNLRHFLDDSCFCEIASVVAVALQQRYVVWMWHPLSRQDGRIVVGFEGWNCDCC